MERLSQTLARKDSTSEPLPDWLPPLHEAGVRLRRGQVCLIVGRPGSGKSMLALHCALNTPVKVLYISSDTDRATMSWRAAASLMNITVDEVEQMVGTSAHDMVEDAIAEVDRRIGFDYTSAPSLRDIELELFAAEEIWGAYPELLVIDSLYSVRTDNGDPYASMQETMLAMHALAHDHGVCVLVLHHASLNRSSADEPASMGAIIGQVSATPEMILSVMLDEEEEGRWFRVGVVKNRSGGASAKAKKQVRIPSDITRMALYASEQERTLAEARRSWE